MLKRTVPLFLTTLLLVASAASWGESGNPVHRVNDRLLASVSELSDEIEKQLRRDLEARHALANCEKYAKNSAAQCVELRVVLARTAARLCGLLSQRAFLHSTMENGGDARGVRMTAQDSCDLK